MTIYNCPTRRPAVDYPWAQSDYFYNATAPLTSVARTDYAGNGGDYYTDPGYGGVWNATGPSDVTDIENPPGQMTSTARTGFSTVATLATGIFFDASLIKMADVTDGTSNTYLVGEKYLCPDYYTSGLDWGDNEFALMGDNEDICRWTASPPMPDTPGAEIRMLFGSAHANGFQMAFCDGSVQMINYSINALVHDYLGNRKDGQPIDGKKF